MSNRLLIVGWGRAGKDECARFMNDHLGLPYGGSTSWAAMPLMAALMKTHPQLAWEHRHENRQFWKDACDRFRENDPLLLIRRALDSTPHARVITGIRDRVEITAAREAQIFRHIVWVERPGVPPDPTVTFDARDATDFIRNDGDLRRFHRNITRWAVQSQLGINPSTYAAALLLDNVQ